MEKDDTAEKTEVIRAVWWKSCVEMSFKKRNLFAIEMMS